MVLDRIGDKWTVLVIGALEAGALRFTELRTRIGGIAPKVLTQTLRAMERDGLLTRTVHAQVPPRVDYELTDLGRSLTNPIATLTDWAETAPDADPRRARGLRRLARRPLITASSAAPATSRWSGSRAPR